MPKLTIIENYFSSDYIHTSEKTGQCQPQTAVPVIQERDSDDELIVLIAPQAKDPIQSDLSAPQIESPSAKIEISPPPKSEDPEDEPSPIHEDPEDEPSPRSFCNEITISLSLGLLAMASAYVLKQSE